MATNNEIEFKQLLSKDVYDKFKYTFFEDKEPFIQINYYIDTPNFTLRDHKSALRIRVKNDTYEMRTARLETNYKNELLVLDRSDYFDKVDYELEFEVTDYNNGLKKFHSLLEEFNLEHTVPNNKVQRFFDYKNQIDK